MKLDIINGTFELCGSFMLARNVLLTYRAKRTQGVSLIATSYFMSWGIFNIFYYPSLGQHWSFLGGICVAVVNSVWVGQIIYYNFLLKRRMKMIKKPINEGNTRGTIKGGCPATRPAPPPPFTVTKSDFEKALALTKETAKLRSRLWK